MHSQYKYWHKAARLVRFFLVAITLQCVAQSQTGRQPSASAPTIPDSGRQEDFSKWPGFLEAVEGGGGQSLFPSRGATAYGGVKIGGAGVTLDLGYDRISSHNGFSTELSGMLPVFRYPRPQGDENRNYLRVYAEPGVGFRAGGSVNVYPSAKVMMALFSDRRLTSSATKLSPFVEVQQRFFLGSGQRSDVRVAIGLMWAICEHCGLE